MYVCVSVSIVTAMFNTEIAQKKCNLLYILMHALRIKINKSCTDENKYVNQHTSYSKGEEVIVHTRLDGKPSCQRPFEQGQNRSYV